MFNEEKVKNLGVAIASIACCGWLFLAAIESMAMDREGCLTCHRYPGLVRFDGPDTFKILHIDEKRYLGSPHGKFTCRRCHTAIVKIPHTGERKVECTTECHRSDKDKRVVKNYPLTDFHKKEQSAINSLPDASSCRVCHPLYPHSENNMVRALLNMHTGFMVCEVCHLKKEKFQNCFYDWKDTENADFIGEPYGTYYNPKLKKAHKSEHFISRIAVFEKLNGRNRLLMNNWDTRQAKDFVASQQRLQAGEKEKRLNFFHRDINRKEISVACDECHSQHGILNFDRLGFGKNVKNNLVNLNIKGLVTKYKIFYFPNLFD
jgi:hypothetical protein